MKHVPGGVDLKDIEEKVARFQTRVSAVSLLELL